MLLSRHQSTRKNHNINIANRYFENVTKFNYFGTTVTKQILVQEEIKRRLDWDNA
jgi:hypothetical protein